MSDRVHIGPRLLASSRAPSTAADNSLRSSSLSAKTPNRSVSSMRHQAPVTFSCPSACDFPDTSMAETSCRPKTGRGTAAPVSGPHDTATPSTIKRSTDNSRE
jgi:hypothetical protein